MAFLFPSLATDQSGIFIQVGTEQEEVRTLAPTNRFAFLSEDQVQPVERLRQWVRSRGRLLDRLGPILKWGT